MDPVKALEYVDTRSTDLLLSDVRMPQLSGVDLGVQVTKKCPECKVLLFSGAHFVEQHPS